MAGDPCAAGPWVKETSGTESPPYRRQACQMRKRVGLVNPYSQAAPWVVFLSNRCQML